MLLGLVLGPPLVAAFTFILQRSGPYVALYLWAFLLAVTLGFMIVYPSIARLFNRFDPLPEGSLRCGLVIFAASTEAGVCISAYECLAQNQNRRASQVAQISARSPICH